MNLGSLLFATIVATIIGKSASIPIWNLIHDIVQNNIAGVPTIHETTKWDFDPEVGKQRRARYENLNGRYGEDLVERLGMGMGYKGPWGVKVGAQKKI